MRVLGGVWKEVSTSPAVKSWNAFFRSSGDFIPTSKRAGQVTRRCAPDVYQLHTRVDSYDVTGRIMATVPHVCFSYHTATQGSKQTDPPNQIFWNGQQVPMPPSQLGNLLFLICADCLATVCPILLALRAFRLRHFKLLSPARTGVDA